MADTVTIRTDDDKRLLEAAMAAGLPVGSPA
jgi:hypothetical protein